MGQIADTPLSRVLRDEGRSQAWLADQIGVNPSRMNLIVHGLIPRQDEADAICRALGRDLRKLWPEADAEAAA